MAEAFWQYYNGWLQGGFFWWVYPINGISAAVEPWHTPLGFWAMHSVLILLITSLIVGSLVYFLNRRKSNEPD